MRIRTDSFLFSGAAGDQPLHLCFQPQNLAQCAYRHPSDFFVKECGFFKKNQHRFDPLVGILLRGAGADRFGSALPQDRERWIDCPPLAFIEDDLKHLPHVFQRFEVVSPVSQPCNSRRLELTLDRAMFKRPAIRLACSGSADT